MKQSSLSWRIIKRVMAFCVALFFVMSLSYYYFTHKTIQKTCREKAVLQAEESRCRINNLLHIAESLPNNIAALSGAVNLPKDSIYGLLRAVVENNEYIYASALAFEPYCFPEEGRYFSPYAYRNGDAVEVMQLGNKDYEYFYMDWYQIPMLQKKPYWTEPYYDEGGGKIIMSTYSAPFCMTNGEGRTVSCVSTIDISLKNLTDIIDSLKILDGGSGYAFLISANGVIISHPDRDLIMNQTIFTIAKERGDDDLYEIGRRMIKGETGFVSNKLVENGDNKSIYYTSLSNKWSIAVVYSNSEINKPLRGITILLIVIMVIGLILLSIIIVKSVQILLLPLKSFSESAKIIASGKFDTKLSAVETNDEMHELYDSFTYMQKSLAEYVVKVRETTVAKEKIESELRIAREIQMGMIPHIFPPFPNLSQIDIYATLKPAKEVGGDLYDFFLIDDENMCFAIGDVSGKGIPASLFMAVTRTLLRSVADKESEPAAIVTTLNKSLSMNNESSMFVTFFLGVINLKNGILTYTNAGHNPPVYMKNDGTVLFFENTDAIPIGLFDNYIYQQKTMQLIPGDSLFLYTDGITEAENSKEELYGEKRLIDVLHQNSKFDLSTIINAVATNVVNHVDGYIQSDDITMMSIIYKGETETSNIRLCNSISEISTMSEFIENISKKWNIPENMLTSLNLVVEEVVSNVILYAWDDAEKHFFDVLFEHCEDGLLSIEVVDDGKPFDPTLRPDPDINLNVEDRPIGGLGIFLVKKIMDKVEYKYIDGCNHLKMSKRI